MTSRFLGALQFLTVLPIRSSAASAAESAIFFPLVGALLGLSAAALMHLLGSHLDISVASLLAIIWLVASTGCLHEDALADVADAFRAGRTREKILLILKDSRIGAFGGVALVLSTLLRWQALAHITIDPLRALPGVLALSRMSLVVLAHIAPSVGGGLGQAFAQGCTRPIAIAVIAQSIALSFLTGWQFALPMILATALVLLLARAYFLRRIGGVNGDCLGAACLVIETVNLVILCWRVY